MRFAKMQATGNDFVLVQTSVERDWPRLAKSMCDRHFGVGADGLIVVTDSGVADLGMRFYNPDGSEAEACGNGLRCLTRYAVSRGYARELCVQTRGGTRYVQAMEGKKIKVGMGKPAFKPAEVPMLVEKALDIILDYPLTVKQRTFPVTCLSMGNPHAVYFLNEPVAGFPLLEIGPLVENHLAFPQRVNFEVAQIVSRSQVNSRVWERGAGETLSCGSGACAVAVAARLHNLADNNVEVVLPGGSLTVEWDGKGEVMLSGPAEVVFWGEWLD